MNEMQNLNLDLSQLPNQEYKYKVTTDYFGQPIMITTDQELIECLIRLNQNNIDLNEIYIDKPCNIQLRHDSEIIKLISVYSKKEKIEKLCKLENELHNLSTILDCTKKVSNFDLQTIIYIKNKYNAHLSAYKELKQEFPDLEMNYNFHNLDLIQVP